MLAATDREWYYARLRRRRAMMKDPGVFSRAVV